MSDSLLWRQALLGGLAAATLGWFLLPPTADSPPLVQARRDAWTLPELPRPVDATARAALLSGAELWGPEPLAQASAPAAEAPRWRLAGLHGAGKQVGVLLMFEDPNTPPQRLRLGDALPNGDVLLALEDKQLLIKSKKKRYRLGVESHE